MTTVAKIEPRCLGRKVERKEDNFIPRMMCAVLVGKMGEVGADWVDWVDWESWVCVRAIGVRKRRKDL